MVSLRACGHLAPAICRAPGCRDWKEAYRLDICCRCQAGRRHDRIAAYAAEMVERARRLELRRQLGYVRQARRTASAIRRQLQARAKAD